MVFQYQKTDAVTVSPSAPAHFVRMFSQNALLLADTYLTHEKEIVTAVLKQNPLIENLVVIGSGPAAYLEIAQDYQCRYIGIDPFYHLKEADGVQIIYFDCPFNEIQRSQLPSGSSLFLFWFNVLHYLTEPAKTLAKIVKAGDIIVYSTWSFEKETTPSMKAYFLEVYKDSAYHYQQVINQIKNNNNQDYLIKELNMVKKHIKEDNQVNSCTIFYL